MRRPQLLRVLILVAVVLLGYGAYSRYRGWAVGRDFAPTLAFTGKSSDLKRTQIVATLDTPIQKGKNVIWCASFQAAWKKLQDDLAGGPVKLEGSSVIADALNRAYTPGPEIPAGSLYRAAGWEDKGILDQIRRDVAQQFPGTEPPAFPGILHGSFVAYSRFEARVRFGLPYFQSTQPLEFTARDGTKTGVSSFGIREEDEYAYNRLREQPRVLCSNLLELRLMGERPALSEPIPPPECIVDLDNTSQPSQIIVAMVEPKATLTETLAAVEAKIAFGGKSRPGVGINDVLLVPDVVYRIAHHFTELEGRKLLNPALKSQPMDVAQEDIHFRLDRSGAQLRAESKMYALPVAAHFIFDHPFLIIMRQRGETRPYFVMWVDNAELLTPMAK